ncbi:DJ-1/PfpI family protein [Breoghania sp. L-A4]|uniref:DJ-1/PfpI family protein n=1 Tax=Breoghania sp. L-A4 TaxID=2304600 RepID=UPI000E3593FD|nr:DJ-1/PfpI family protein [Breoghania sp. L-A4]AXS42819.1 DJ-1/PfpI family protein [Breoghania sp. L-A4]
MIIGMPVYPHVDLLDVTGPYEILGWMRQFAPPAEIRLIGQSDCDVTTRDGFTFKVSHTFETAGQLDVLWVPGGDPDELKRIIADPQRTYLDFLIRQAQGARYVCSVCEGALLLAAAGLLDGFEATTHWAFIPCLKEYPDIKVAPGAPRYVHDRNRLTGGGISSGLDESLKLVELLHGTEMAERVQRMTQYFPDPPVSADLPVATTCPLN